MQKDQLWSLRDASRDAEDFKAVALDGELECLAVGGWIHIGARRLDTASKVQDIVSYRQAQEGYALRSLRQ